MSVDREPPQPDNTQTDATVTGSDAWRDEVAALGCYRCGHEATADDPCDEGCDGLFPMSWSQRKTVVSP